MPVDILIPAALGNQITEDIARKTQARLIVEGANGPTTYEGDLILEERGIPVVPDILANSGRGSRFLLRMAAESPEFQLG